MREKAPIAQVDLPTSKNGVKLQLGKKYKRVDSSTGNWGWTDCFLSIDEYGNWMMMKYIKGSIEKMIDPSLAIVSDVEYPHYDSGELIEIGDIVQYENTEPLKVTDLTRYKDSNQFKISGIRQDNGEKDFWWWSPITDESWKRIFIPKLNKLYDFNGKEIFAGAYLRHKEVNECFKVQSVDPLNPEIVGCFLDSELHQATKIEPTVNNFNCCELWDIIDPPLTQDGKEIKVGDVIKCNTVGEIEVELIRFVKCDYRGEGYYWGINKHYQIPSKTLNTWRHVDLKPCPFCGSEATARKGIISGTYVSCSNDGCDVCPDVHFNSSKVDAYLAWNKRS